ncbi:MAG TPA: ABC transporter substrate-binding protein [bacterium]|nr:ABC transporter substrate-binding protein [bacterium]
MPKGIKFLSVFITLCIILSTGASGFAQKKTIRMDARDYYPRERLSTDRWNPPTYLWKLEKEYERLHPDIDIQFIRPPEGMDADVWLTTQLTGGTAPEISEQLFSEVNRNAYKGWYVDLAPFLEKPNPYVKDNKKWKDIFLEIAIATGKAADGKSQYVLPTGITGTAIFYNKDIFKKVGIRPPSTWKEFMDIQEKIKRAGYIPFAFPMAGEKMRANWSLRTIQDMILDSKMAEIKGVKGKIKRTAIEASAISQKELVQAIKRGVYSARDPQWQEQLRLFKEWSKYWEDGYLGVDSQGAYMLFINGQAAMMYESAAQIKPVEVDPLRKFEYGLFYFPRITKESSPYATGISAAAVGGVTGAGSWIIPYTTSNKRLVDETIDWLMFITAPQNYIPMANDLGAAAPALKARKGLDKRLEPFVKSLERGVFRIESFYRGLTREYAEAFYQILQQYLADKLTLQQACEQIQVEMEKAANALIDTHPEWGIKK